MPLKLVRPDWEYEEQVMHYKEAMRANGDSFDGCSGLEWADSFAHWLDFEDRLRKRYGAGYVPTKLYLAVRTEDGKVVGMIDYRLELSPFLLNYGGNIGYSVLPEERQKGYASQMLKLLLPVCREHGAAKVLVTCERSNEASRRVIVKNGGIMENEVADDVGVGSCGWIQRYWITL